MFRAEGKGENAIREGGFFDWKLRDGAILVFDFDRQIVGLQKWLGTREHFGQATGEKAMIHVVSNPCLQEADGSAVNNTSTVDERFIETTDFGNVSVRGNDIAIRQDEAEFGVWMRGEVRFEFADFHR